MRSVQLAMSFMVVLAATSGQMHAAMISINNYDITDATRSGFGLWSHVYGGTITDTGSFSAYGSGFTRANYTGGSGTLNDGLLGTSALDTQLFVNNSNANPQIVLNISGLNTISGITLFSFDDGENSIPGTIRGFDVTINAITQSFLTSELTPHNEFVNLIGSSLDGLATNQIILSNFLHDGTNTLTEVFAIGEISIQGEPAVASVVPEPSSIALFGIGAIGMSIVVVRRRKAKLQTSLA